MSETAMSFADMLNQAKEAGGTSEEPPPGKYVGVVVSSNAKRSKSGDKTQVGIKLRVEQGPHTGAGIWSTETLTLTNATALDIWFRTFEALGIPRDWWGQYGTNYDAAAAAAAEYIKGKTCEFTVANQEWPKGSGTMNARVSRIAKAPAPGAAPAAVTPAVVIPPAPVAPAAPAPPGPPAPGAPAGPPPPPAPPF